MSRLQTGSREAVEASCPMLFALRRPRLRGLAFVRPAYGAGHNAKDRSEHTIQHHLPGARLTEDPQVAPVETFPRIDRPPEIRKRQEEQAKLIRELKNKTRHEPFLKAGSLLDWYSERVKESRTRLAHGSADSAEAVLLLMKYAGRRRDIYTLRRLRTLVLAWTQEHLEKAALRPSAGQGSQPLLLMRLDNMLFSLAAQHDNWSAMHMLASSRSSERWTPFMCRALLRTDGALDMVTKEPGSSDSLRPLEPSESKARKELWDMFLDEFGQMIRRSHLIPPENAPQMLAPLPNWITAALLELYSRSGRTTQALTLMNMHLASHYAQLSKRPVHEDHITLHRGPSRLITNSDVSIPGPVILNALLSSFLRTKSPLHALRFFEMMTRTPLKLTAETEAQPLPIDTRFVLEPNTKSVLLVIDAFLATTSNENGNKLLNLLQKVEKTWGLLAPEPVCNRPLILDLRPFMKLLLFGLKTNDKELVRRVLRYQQGVLRREKRWQNKPTNDGRVDWREQPNGLTLLKRWEAILNQLCKRAWINRSHAQALYSLAKRLTLRRRPTYAGPTPRRRGRHTQHT